MKQEKLYWQRESCPSNALQALVESFSKTSKDFGCNKFDAWVYGIICGWDDASYKELAAIHNWSNDQIEYNKLLHANYNNAWNLFIQNTINESQKEDRHNNT